MRRHPITIARTAHRFSIPQLAEFVGATPAELQAWERGEQYPDPKVAVRLARALQMPLCDVYWTVIEASAAAGAIPTLKSASQAVLHPSTVTNDRGQLKWATA